MTSVYTIINRKYQDIDTGRLKDNFFLFSNSTTCPLWTSWSPLPVIIEVFKTSEFGTPMRRSYVVPVRWMVIYEYEVPGGALNLSSSKLPFKEKSPW
jgi:hypothetical protein